MSEESKNNIIKSIYNDKNGFGSMRSTHKKAKQKNNSITYKNVQDWFFWNVNNDAKSGINNRFINNRAYQEYQIDLIFFGKESKSKKDEDDDDDDDDDEDEDADEDKKAKPGEYKKLALSMIDIFSKFAVVIPMESKEGPAVSSAVLEGIKKMNPNKNPDMIYCDNDTLFRTTLVQLMRELKIHLYVTKHSAMIDERFNRTFKNMIWKRLKASGKDRTQWTSFIDEVLVTYNYEMVSSATGMTPNEARKPANTLQVKIALEMRRGKTRKHPPISVGDYVKTFFKKQTQNKKENVPNWSKKVYKVERVSETFGQKYYHLEGETRPYLIHDLRKVPGP
jgi:hypothetical protein